jgi:hypothetical protein
VRVRPVPPTASAATMGDDHLRQACGAHAADWA